MKVDIAMAVGHTDDELLYTACHRAGYHTNRYKILRRSIDARHKSVKLNYTIELDPCDDTEPEELFVDDTQIKRPIVIGLGPSGLLAGYYLALYGFKPLILERGSDIDSRSIKTEKFWHTGVLDPNSNTQFGEGGAGTFSDGKLTTRINDRRCNEVLKLLVDCGAPEEILYYNKPHIGTDRLAIVVKNMRSKIIQLGGEVKFDVKVDSITVHNDRISGVTANGDHIPCTHAVFAIGHSARDTYKMLLDEGVAFRPKPFAIGVRIEHLQQDIDGARYGKYAGHPDLGAADYQLAARHKGIGCFSFCMCPGGIVVASASEQGEVVTNGMSFYARDKVNANSALLVGVSPKEYGTGVFDGIEFQKRYETAAYKLSNSFSAPIQRLDDFVQGIKSKQIGRIKPSYTNGHVFANLADCLPRFVTDTIAGCMNDFNKKISGFSVADAILTGVETRSSAPVTMMRGEDMQSVTVKGLYPCGEGAGYAGGIMSAAVDGMKVAESIITNKRV